ncbi:MAG TPA: thiosulfate oxidation carrier protein SoxY [Xanthobacteraceae bacterium]|jgi:sulfur-oxidizing protein SoxY|nr:thiosulfate oxidation carrier protein SoxY [Xanthobacteraceae bacterium]
MTFNQLQTGSRRTMLKASLAALALGVSGMAQRAFAAADASIWPKDAFAAKSDADTLKLLYGKETEASDQIKLDAPEIAENGAVVPVSISTTLPNVTSISIMVTDNPSPLVASYKIPAGTAATVSNRIKMAKTSKVIALVESNGKIFSANKEVKVTVGGCGG